MMYSVHCTKCDRTSKLDIGEMSREDVEKWLDDSKNGFQCFGNHVELGARSDFWEIDWENPIEGSAPTEEEFLAEVKSKYKIVLNTSQIQEQYTDIEFTCGMCYATNKNTGETILFNFTHSPKGTRYYYADAV